MYQLSFHVFIYASHQDPEEDVIIVEKTSSCSCRMGIDYPKLQMEEEEEELTHFCDSDIEIFLTGRALKPVGKFQAITLQPLSK